jgi:DMSO reductase anchor subunit
MAGIAAGMAAIYCSAQLYVATRRPLWNARRTIVRFALTALLLGNAACIAMASVQVPHSNHLLSDYRYVLAAMAVSMIVVAWRSIAEARFWKSSPTNPDPTIRAIGELLADRPLRYVVRKRRSWAAAAAFGLPLLMLMMLASLPDSEVLRFSVAGMCFVQFAFALASEIAERYLFFTACVSPRMPGGLA